MGRMEQKKEREREEEERNGCNYFEVHQTSRITESHNSIFSSVALPWVKMKFLSYYNAQSPAREKLPEGKGANLIFCLKKYLTRPTI